MASTGMILAGCHCPLREKTLVQRAGEVDEYVKACGESDMESVPGRDVESGFMSDASFETAVSQGYQTGDDGDE